MAKLPIIFWMTFWAFSTCTEVQTIYDVATDFMELEKSFTDIKITVMFIINEVQETVNQYPKLLAALDTAGRTTQLQVGIAVNQTVMEFTKKVNKLVAEATVDVDKCTYPSPLVESAAINVLKNTNNCIRDKLEKARMNVREAMAYVDEATTRLKRLKNIAMNSFSEAVKTENVSKLQQSLLLIKSIRSEPEHITGNIASTLMDATLSVARLSKIMMSDCVRLEDIACFSIDTQNVYSRIETCIADMN